jgi:predicted house-cleaning noncanonical NTP pyrophosphatase (MazG superfamily)
MKRMRTFRFDKLVRDKIVAQQQQGGGKPDYRVLEGREYLEALKTKILEEASELDVADADELVKELADLQEIIDCIVEAIGASKDDVAKAQAKKNAKAGSFKEKLYIENVTVPDDNEWIDYYLKNSDRYPEVS